MDPKAAHSTDSDFDAVVVGAGFAGLYALYKLRAQGLRVRVFEAGSGVGGTWFWNRYPGARCDVPSLEYSYGFSKELEQEWNWTEIMPSQPEILRYLEHVTDRFELRRDIQFETRVSAAHFDENACCWRVETDAGDRCSARYCIMATGCLSVPLTSAVEAAPFEGAVYYTGLWPHEPVDLGGKRVAVVGTGSSGVQLIPVVAEQAAHVTVFQRTPTFTLPAHNAPLADDFQARVKRNYRELRAMQRASELGISSYAMPPGASAAAPNLLDLSDEARRAVFERLGFNVIRAFADVRTDIEANKVASDLYCEMVHRTVDDPETAEALSPRDYPAGCKRLVVDTDYFLAFNRPNVTLVDLHKGAIEAVTARGLRTESAEYEFDVLVFATGFDAMTGALSRIDIRGRGGRSLLEKWSAGPRSFLGLQSAGFPNLFTVSGPGSPSVLTNMVASIEQHVEWIADCIAHLDENAVACIEPRVDAEDAWIEHVNEIAQGTMFTAPSCNSWYLGVNVPGKPRAFMPYVGGLARYIEACDEIVAKGYEGFELSS